ncbi:glutamine synthetase family protein [Mucilaginibacter sp. L3T2-6]|uniref:glutamine synthetase family protein n=1 Tax=Mucilaginibacter sp. L3T2-6 TaxID=3062491 RepID=UPI002676B517|nr:glutamine synthetase family protein [Mucilaginibacter sp. L3T2-6]MDO3641195.1 glutamine synthetase family protein [Mucilaginibacter sp. L3T2-6]MDV6213329.1 glutamine synthetase family protein [Mucilaginibacter sp. L3T2-6]
MNEEQVKKYLKENDIQKIKFAFADIDGVLRGKMIHPKKFIDGLESGYGFCDVVWGWDSSDTVYDNVKLTGWHTGYPDQMCRIDLSTLRNVPWDNDIPFFLADFSKADGNDLAACGRSLLKRIAKQCAGMGYHAEFAQEFEWFNFVETPQSLKEKSFTNLESLTPGMFGYSILRTSLNDGFYNDLFDLLLQFNIPLEGLHTETGPGVYEAAILHDEVLAAADKAVLFKTAVKEIAGKHDIMATFMAKWSESLPGCSGHIHQSLWTKDQSKNLFYSADDEYNMSDLHKHYLAGQLYCLPQILPMYAPTINSYKRLVEGAWAPTTITWGIDNRTTALRVIHTSEKYTRLETRIPGSDTNPYLAMAAALASGLYGIKNKLPLTIPASTGNGYEDKRNGILSPNLFEATSIMKNSALAKELFGEAFVDHFTNTRLWEWRQYSKAVTDWELKRYFEII